MMIASSSSRTMRAARASPALSPACSSPLHHFEAPLSGMSMNPARTLRPGAARAGGSHASGSISSRRRSACSLAAELYVRARGARGPLREAPSPTSGHCIFRCAAAGETDDHDRHDHYDVIIIGTGAGGGTLAYRLAPSGKRILLLERGDYVPREKDNWDSRAVNVEAQVPHQGGVARQATASRCIRTRTTTSAATRNSTARRCSGCASEDFGELRAPRRRLAGLADRLRRPRAVLHRGRAPLSGARRARRGSDGAVRRARRIRIPAVSHEPRIQQLHDDFARAGLQPVPRAARHQARRAGSAARAAASAATRATASRVWCTRSRDAQVVCVDPALAHPNVTLLTNAYVDALETSASGREVTRGASSSATAAPETYSGDIVVVVVRRDQLGGVAAALGERPASARPRPTARTSSAATTWATSTRC